MLRILNSRTTWLHREPKIEVLLIGLSLIIASLLGPAVINRGVEVLGWLGLPVGGLLVLIHPVLGMLSVAATLPFEAMAMVGEAVTFTRVLGMAVFGLWLSRELVRRASWQPMLTPGVVKASIGLLVLAFASTLWTRNTSFTLAAVFTLVSLILWSLLVSDLASSWHRIAWLARVLVIAALVAAILAIQQYFVESAKRAGGGIAGGINATAYTLVIIIPFAFYLIRAKESPVWRLVGILYLLLATVAVGVTFSRTSYLMLLLAMLAEYWGTIKGRGKRSWLLIVTGVVVIVIMLSPLDLIGERAQTIGPYIVAAITGEVAEEGWIGGRGIIYRVGFAMFRDHPLTGVGYGNFQWTYAEYSHYVPGALYLPRRSSHSSYLSFLTELGLPGLLLWIVILGVALRNLIIAWSTLSRTGPSMQFYLVRAVTYSFLLHLSYGWARLFHNEKAFWLLLGLSVVVRRLAEQSQALQADADVSSAIVSSSASGAKL